MVTVANNASANEPDVLSVPTRADDVVSAVSFTPAKTPPEPDTRAQPATEKFASAKAVVKLTV
jgi:hypothetical protein